VVSVVSVVQKVKVVVVDISEDCLVLDQDLLVLDQDLLVLDQDLLVLDQDLLVLDQDLLAVDQDLLDTHPNQFGSRSHRKFLMAKKYYHLHLHIRVLAR
jgi:hypothetical protein